MRNLAALLEAAGSSLGRVVKTTIFLAKWDDFSAMNEAYAEFFPQNGPARSTVETRRPPGVLVGVDAIAVVKRP